MPVAIKILIILILIFILFAVDMCNQQYYEKQYKEIEKDTVKIKIV